MHRYLTLFVSLHWSVVFALFAAMATFDPVSDGPTAALIATGFAMAAVLFLWTLLAGLAGGAGGWGDMEELTRKAFLVSLVLLAVIVAIGAALPGAGLFRAVAPQFFALIGSWLALNTIRPPAPVLQASEAASALRLRAIGAVHATLLGQVAGRTTRPEATR
jgi:hypothetical protein